MADPGVESEIVQEFIDFVKISMEAERFNRDQGLEALQFYCGGDAQWDATVLKTRRTPGYERPADSYNQLPNFVGQVVNDGRMNSTQTKFIPEDDSEEAKEIAEKYEDKARDIQAQPEAQIAYDTALYGQCIPGWGYWRYVTEYENNESFDQIVKIQPIENPFTIYDDPFVPTSRQLERKRLVQATMVPLNDYKRDYDDETMDALTLEGIGDKSPGWATKDSIRVAEGWKVIDEKSMLYRNKKTGKTTTTKPKDLHNYDSREVINPKVMWYKFNAVKVLEKIEWIGCHIPYIKVVGREINVDGKTIVEGIVKRAIPAQKQINYATNAAMEAVALAPLSPIIADPTAIAKYEDIWNSANIINYAYLPSDTYDDEGRQLQQPRRADNGRDIGNYVQIMEMAQQNFYNLTGIFPASLGQASNEKSGKAIMARQREGDVSTFDIHDNHTRGQLFGGIILEDLIRKVYDGSRTVTMRREDGTTYAQKINQPFKDKQGKSKNYDFTKGKRTVAIVTGPSVTTKRQEAAENQIQLLQSMGEAMAPALPLIIRTQDWPSADKIADAVERGLPPELRDPEKLQEEQRKIPPQVAMQLQQQEQVIQQMGQALQQAEQTINQGQAEAEAKVIESQSKVQTEQMKAELQLRSNAIKEQEIALQHEELRVREIELAAQVQMKRIDAKTAMQASPDAAMSDPDLYEGGITPIQQMMGMMAETLNAGLMQVAQATQQGTAEVVQINMALANAIQQQTLVAAQPKQIAIQRDPVTGLIASGVVN